MPDWPTITNKIFTYARREFQKNDLTEPRKKKRKITNKNAKEDILVQESSNTQLNETIEDCYVEVNYTDFKQVVAYANKLNNRKYIVNNFFILTKVKGCYFYINFRLYIYTHLHSLTYTYYILT